MKLNIINKTLLGLLVAIGLLLGALPAFAAPLSQQAVITATVVENANLRAGPGTIYAIVGKAKVGQVVQIVASNPAGDWYKLAEGKWIAAFLAKLTPTAAASEAPITVVSWNTELNNADIGVIAERIAAFQAVDLWGLSEVNRESSVATLETAAEAGENADYASILSISGGGDRLLAMYDTTRFDLLDSFEIDEINTTGNARAPLVLYLREKQSGDELLFMVNHLYRTRDDERHAQAALLNQWAAEQTLPVIAVGDYNFDWNVSTGAQKHDAGYDLLTANDRFAWVQPKTLVTTQCSGWPCGFNSVLDFVFVAGPAQGWRAESEIVVAAGDFPDDETTSDHRPLLAQFWPSELTAATTLAVLTAPPLSTPLPATAKPAPPQATAIPVAIQPTATPVPAPPTVVPPVAPISSQTSVAILVIENRSTFEIIGIRNSGATAVDIGGWVFSGSKGGDSCTIPGGSVLQPGQVYQVATGDSQPSSPGYKCGNKPIWNNKGEIIYLDWPGGQEVLEY